jgi:hypothetical protein
MIKPNATQAKRDVKKSKANCKFTCFEITIKCGSRFEADSKLTKVPALESPIDALDEALDIGLDFAAAAAAAASAASFSIFFRWAMVLRAPIPAIFPSALKRIEPRLPL